MIVQTPVRYTSEPFSTLSFITKQIFAFLLASTFLGEIRPITVCCSELSCTPVRPNWISANFISSIPRELWPCSPLSPSLRNYALDPDGRTRLAYLNVKPSFCMFTCLKLIIETFGGVRGQTASVFCLMGRTWSSDHWPEIVKNSHKGVNTSNNVYFLRYFRHWLCRLRALTQLKSLP